MPRLQIIIFLTILTAFFACKDTNSSTSAETRVPAVEDIDTSYVNPPSTIQYYSWVDKLRLRAQPDTKSKVVAELKEGSLLDYLFEKTDFTQKITLRGKAYDEPWYKIRTAEGIEGWVYGGGVLKDKPKMDALPTPYDKCLEMKDHNYKSYEICISRTKSQQLKKDKQYVKQLPNKLQFNLLSGETKILSDKKGQGETRVLYDYRFYIPQMSFFVVRANLEEGGEYVLINDKTGAITKIVGYPRPAPGYRHLLTVNADLEAGFEFNGFQLWSYTDNGFEKILERDLRDFAPLTARWLDKQTVEVLVHPASHDKSREPKLMVLRQGEDGAWGISEEEVEE